MRRIRILSSAFVLASLPFSVNSEGLERFNIDPGFLFGEGNTANLSFASVSPSIGATSGSALINLEDGLEVAPSFSAVNLSVKSSLNEKIDVGLFYTNSGNGVLIDWGTISGLATSTNVTIGADLKMPTLAALGKYKINDNISLFGGLKRTTVNDGAYAKVARDLDGNGTLDETSTWTLSETSEMGMVYGAAYEMPEIALRVSLTIEDDIDLEIATVGTGVIPAATGTSNASIGDAMTLHFQSGIAEDTLLFGSIRRSNWEDNQVSVPLSAIAQAASGGATHAELSTFEDGTSYSLGIGRKINDELSLSISAFYDGGDGTDTSELAPTGANRSISFGGRYAIAENADLSGGINYSMRSDSTTENLGAVLNDSSVMTIGASIAFDF